MFVFLEIALRNLVQARRRTILLGLGLIFVTFMLISLLALSRSVADQLLEAATTLSSGHVNVAGFHKAKPSDAAPYVTRVAELRKVVEENTPGLDYVTERYRGWVQLSSETDSLQTGVAGVDIGNEPKMVELLQLAKESEYRDDGGNEVLGDVRQLGSEDAIVIFVSHAKQLGVTVGDSLTVVTQTPEGITNTRDVRVVAVARDISMLSAWTVFMPNNSLRTLYTGPEDTTGALHVFLKDPTQAEEVMAHLRKVLTDKGFGMMEYNPQPFWMKFESVAGEDWIGQKLDLTYWKDEISFLVWILTVVDAVSVFLVTILLVIIGVGITNTMWIAVRERTGEIGTLRAIGMSKRRVLLMFLLEAAMLGVGATLLGGLFASAVASVVSAAGIELPPGPIQSFLMTDTLRLAVTSTHVVGSVIAITGVTVLASLWPALRASRLQPVTAIQRVN